MVVLVRIINACVRVIKSFIIINPNKAQSFLIASHLPSIISSNSIEPFNRIPRFRIIIQAQIKSFKAMDKDTLLNIIYQKSMQRKSSKKLKASPVHQQKINSKIQIRQEAMAQSSKMIKITQFKSELVVNQEKYTQKSYKSSISNSPQKSFNIKKVSEAKSRTIANAQKIIEIQLKRKDKVGRKKYVEEMDSTEEVQRLLKGSKWALKSDNKHNDLSASVGHTAQTVIVIKATEKRPQSSEASTNHLELSQNILFGKSKDIQPKEQTTKPPSKQKSRPKLAGQQVFIGCIDTESLVRKFSASPRKGYSRHIEQQKRYQQNIQRQKREMLEMKKELNKNYAKPFHPPQNVTAFSYIVYEADAKRNSKLRKYSAKRYDAQELTEMRKIFLHSHQVIVSLNSRTAVEIASLTKIMTCVIALDLSKRFSLDLKEEIVKIGLFQQNIGGTSANIKKGEIYTIEQLLHGLMLPSGNDASLAIAVWGGRILIQKQDCKRQNESSALSISTATNIQQKEKTKPKIKKRQFYERFIQQMNSKANELNMQKTNYCNSHGLSNPDNRSCSFDLAILSEYAMSSPQFRRIVSCKVYQTEIKIESNQSTKDLQGNKESRKLLKKRSGINVNHQGLMQLQEMKDMDGIFQDKFFQEEEGGEESKETSSKLVRWQNTHQLLQQKPDLYIGIKTGITNTAGPCLASCFQVKGRRFIVIVLNCKSMKQRLKDTQSLRRWLFAKEGIKYCQKRMERAIIEEEGLL